MGNLFFSFLFFFPEAKVWMVFIFVVVLGFFWWCLPLPPHNVLYHHISQIGSIGGKKFLIQVTSQHSSEGL